MRERIGGGKETEPGKKLNLSKSQFITYLSCPKKYYWKYIKGYTEPSDKPNFIKGNAIHEFWENMYEEKYVLVDEHSGSITLQRQKLSREMRNHQKLINNIREFEEKRLNRILDQGLDPKKYFYPIAQEERIEVEGMRGLPDAIYRRPDGTLEVFDLKSSLYSGWKHKFEVLFYAKLVDKSDLYDAPVTGGVLFSASDQQVEYHNFDKWDLLEFERKISKARKGIKNKKFEPCGIGYCDYDYTPPEDAYRDPDRVRR